MMSLHIRVGFEKASVLAETQDSLSGFPEQEVDKGQATPDQILLIAEEGSDGSERLKGLGDDLFTRVRLESHADWGHEGVTNYIKEHENLALLANVSAEELRSPFLADVLDHCLGLGDPEITVDKVG